MSTTVEIYDTTLRDGTQREGLSLTVNDKLRIARLIDQLGVQYIEGGWPGANPKDDEFFRRARDELMLKHATLVAFGSTRRANGSAKDDPQLQALLDAATDVICLVGKSWDYHVTEALRTTLDEAEAMVTDSIEFLVGRGKRVFFDAEHFFDGYAANPEFAVRIAGAAHRAGAERVILCDTNGGTMPHAAAEMIATVRAELPEAVLGCHFHNDGGVAAASSLAAVRAGVVQVQGCMNGYGERTGNADLTTVIANLVLKMDLPVVDDAQLASLSPISHHIAEIVNLTLDPQHPYVGTSAFAHKAGLHTSALARRPDAYEHVHPELVGNTTRMVVSELAGRSTVLAKATQQGWDLDPATAQAVVDKVKELEHRGYVLEAADGSFELLVREAKGWKQDFFEVESFRTYVEQRIDGEVVAEATVKVRVGDERVIMTREGTGPVHALDRALRAALAGTYPEVAGFRLSDFRVRDLDSSDGAAARVRVLIEHTDGEGAWSTTGVHPNIIEASWEALVGGVVLGLLRATGDVG
jgi:2-isopropylmalate synthase